MKKKELRLTTFLLTFLLMLGISFITKAQQTYTAVLSGNNEVLPVMTVASGNIEATLIGTQLTVTGSFQNLSSPYTEVGGSGSGAHIHLAYAGSNGAIHHNLTPNLDDDSLGGTFNSGSNQIQLTASEVTALQNRQLYVNIHTGAHKSGELRGQLLPESGGSYLARLNGDNMNPPVASNGHAQVIAELNGSQLTLSGSFNNLTTGYSGAKLHMGGRDYSSTGFYNLNADFTGNKMNGVFQADSNSVTLTQAQLDSLQQGKLYIDIHTSSNPGGELRGQLITGEYTTYKAPLTGTQQVSPVFSLGSGKVTMKRTGDQFILSGALRDLESKLIDIPTTGTSAHIHKGMAGENGGIMINLDMVEKPNKLGGTFRAQDNVYILSNSMIEALDNRMLYINIHTQNNKPGELRGQIAGDYDEFYLATLSGASETPSVLTSGHGRLVVELYEAESVLGQNSFRVSGRFDDLASNYNSNAGYYIKIGAAGSNTGGIPFLFDPGLDADQKGGYIDTTFNLSDPQTGDLRNRNYYVQVTSQNEPVGEIRGQILPLSEAYFHASLSGLNAVPPRNSAAFGGVKLELKEDTLVLTGSFDDLNSTVDTTIRNGAHLHTGSAGTNGGIDLELMPTLDGDGMGGEFTATQNTFVLSSGQIDDLRAGNYYVNIHTSNVPAGAVRGQVLHEPNGFPTSTKVTFPTPGDTVEIGGNPNDVYQPAWPSSRDNSTVVYGWLLTEDQSMNNVVHRVYAATDTLIGINYKKMDSILKANGIQDEGTFYQRVFSGDGSEFLFGSFTSITFVRKPFTGIDEDRPGSWAVILYPNPVVKNLHLRMRTHNRSEVRFELYNLLGEKVIKRELGQLPAGENEVKIDAAELSPGIYTYRVISESAEGLREAQGKLNVSK